MGMSESTIKVMTEPINNLVGVCGHSDCKTKCGECFEIHIDTVQQLPTIQPRESSRDSMGSSITKIVERHDTHTHIKTTNA